MGKNKSAGSAAMRFLTIAQIIIFMLIGCAAVSHAKTEAALDAKADVYMSLSIAQLTEVPI